MKCFMKAIAATMLTVSLIVATGCTPEDDPNNSGNNNPNQTELPAGMYLGVIGFNTNLYTKPIARLDANSVQAAKVFIDNLSLGGATVLYHAVNTSMDMLVSNSIPKDLVSVSIVTFTDGLDKGSHALNADYNSGAEYLKAVTRRIKNEKINGHHIEAHVIGFQGNDIYSFDEAEFKNNLDGLSSSQDNVHLVDNFEDVQVAFDSIAARLHKQSVNSKLTIKMPVEDPNTRVRFTLDITSTDPDAALASENYIEGVYVTGSDGNGVLTNVQYKGMKSTSGGTVTSVTEGVFAKFNFENMQDSNSNPFSNQTIAHLAEWVFNTNANSWIHNSEFSSDGNTEITNEYFSSMIMLNLDCSQSLGDDMFKKLKKYAKDFVDGLKINK